MNELKLKDWTNANDVGTRFPMSLYKCPQCGKSSLMDEWPPNYCGGSGSIGEHSRFDDSGVIKHVCKECKIFFRVGWRRITIDGKVEEESHNMFDITPLEEKNGYLLTPHDVYLEKYKEEHGEYPQEAYA